MKNCWRQFVAYEPLDEDGISSRTRKTSQRSTPLSLLLQLITGTENIQTRTLKHRETNCNIYCTRVSVKVKGQLLYAPFTEAYINFMNVAIFGSLGSSLPNPNVILEDSNKIFEGRMICEPAVQNVGRFIKSPA